MEKGFTVDEAQEQKFQPSSGEKAGEQDQEQTEGKEKVSECDGNANPDCVDKDKGDSADVEADDKAGDDPEYMDTGKGDSNDEEAEDNVDDSDHGGKGRWSSDEEQDDDVIGDPDFVVQDKGSSDDEEENDIVYDPDYVDKGKGSSMPIGEEAEDDAVDGLDYMDTDRGGSDYGGADGSSDDDDDDDRDIEGSDEEGSANEEMEGNAEVDPDCADTDEEEEEQPIDLFEDDEAAWQSKDGKVTWFPTQPGIHRRQSAVKIPTPGPTHFTKARVTDIKSSFDIFMTEEILKIVTRMTNIQGRRVHADWKDIDIIDLQAYIGLLIIAGVYRSKHEATKSLWDKESGRPIFRATMSVNTFHVLSRIIRFDDLATRAERRKKDKMAAFRDVWDKWVERLPMIFNPGPDVSVDERLFPFRGRCPFKQYIPNKPAKYGIKIWAACDVKTSYAWNMQVYTGKSADGAPETNQGMRVVLDMTSGLRGHNVTCDNFFTSYALGEELLRRKMTMLGTMRKSKTELPPVILMSKRRAIHSSVFASTDTHTLVSYIPRKGKNVVLLSTKHKNAAVSGREDKKPDMILDYNHTKGGVDNLDKVTGAYSVKRKTCRWPLVLFFNIIDVSAYNAFVVWTEIDPSWNQGKTFRRRLFLAELGKALITPLIERRQRGPQTAVAASAMRDVQVPHIKTEPIQSRCSNGKRKWCDFCPADGIKRSKIATTCAKCIKHICKGHTITFCGQCSCSRKR